MNKPGSRGPWGSGSRELVGYHRGVRAPATSPRPSNPLLEELETARCWSTPPREYVIAAMMAIKPPTWPVPSSGVGCSSCAVCDSEDGVESVDRSR